MKKSMMLFLGFVIVSVGMNSLDAMQTQAYFKIDEQALFPQQFLGALDPSSDTVKLLQVLWDKRDLKEFTSVVEERSVTGDDAVACCRVKANEVGHPVLIYLGMRPLLKTLTVNPQSENAESLQALMHMITTCLVQLAMDAVITVYLGGTDEKVAGLYSLFRDRIKQSLTAFDDTIGMYYFSTEVKALKAFYDSKEESAYGLPAWTKDCEGFSSETVVVPGWVVNSTKQVIGDTLQFRRAGEVERCWKGRGEEIARLRPAVKKALMNVLKKCLSKNRGVQLSKAEHLKCWHDFFAKDLYGELFKETEEILTQGSTEEDGDIE